MNDDMTDELAPRAEIFRSKLIEDFQLIDMIVNSGGAEPPKYYSNEITGNCFVTTFSEIFQVCCLANNSLWSNVARKLFATSETKVGMTVAKFGKQEAFNSSSHVCRLSIQFLRSFRCLCTMTVLN